MLETFKVRISNETGDEHLKMSIVYHIPIKNLPDLVQWLEQVKKEK